jgi:4-hydroxy-2-oxoglutarate aldolase
MKLQGIYVDAATPFDHAGELYRVKIEHNIAKWNHTSVAGYVIGGYTGEGALLTTEEKSALWKIAARCAGPDKALIAGIEAAGVRAAVEQTGLAAEAGFAVALVETPFADPLMRARDVQLLFFRAVADRSPIPLLISHRPAVTGVDLDADAIRALGRHPNIQGVVDHSGCVERFMGMGEFPWLCGSEAATWSSLASGASGAVLAFANAAPYAAIALWEAFRTREGDAGLDWQSRISPAAAVAPRLHGIAGLKHAMDCNGYYGGPPRLPWPTADPRAKDEVRRAFADLKS